MSRPRDERPSSASATREALDRAICAGGLSPSSATAPQGALRLRHGRCQVLQPSILPRPREEPHSASGSSARTLTASSPPLRLHEVLDSTAAREAIDRAIRGMVLPPSSASATCDAPQRPRPRSEAPSSTSAYAREVLRRALTTSSPPICLHGMLASTTYSPLLTEHPVTSIGTLRSSLSLPLSNRPSDANISGPVLLITNPEFPGCTLFSPYTMRAFTRRNYPIDIMNVLYSDGDLFLLKDGTRVSVWEVNSETSLCTFELDVDIEQGYFRGTPTSGLTVVLARQRVFLEQIDNVDEAHGGQDIVAEFWLRRSDGDWQQNAMVCAHMGMHSLTIHGESLFWLSDNGTLCSVTQTEEGLVLQEWEGAVESVGSSFALLEDLNTLYIVKSGGILPNAAAIYRVVLGDPPAFPETRLNGKDVFIVHGKSGFLLPNQTTDRRVYSAPLIEDADCSRFSYTHNRHDNIRPCQSEFFHEWCFAAWAVMQTSH